jgi:hypothetical protein
MNFSKLTGQASMGNGKRILTDDPIIPVARSLRF